MELNNITIVSLELSNIATVSLEISDNNYLFGCSLGVEPVDEDVICQPPRKVKDPIITRHLITNVLISAALIISGTLWVFWHEVCLSTRRNTQVLLVMTSSCLFCLTFLATFLFCIIIFIIILSLYLSVFVIHFEEVCFTQHLAVRISGFSLMD